MLNFIERGIRFTAYDIRSYDEAISLRLFRKQFLCLLPRFLFFYRFNVDLNFIEPLHTEYDTSNSITHRDRFSRRGSTRDL